MLVEKSANDLRTLGAGLNCLDMPRDVIDRINEGVRRGHSKRPDPADLKEVLDLDLLKARVRVGGLPLRRRRRESAPPLGDRHNVEIALIGGTYTDGEAVAALRSFWCRHQGRLRSTNPERDPRCDGWVAVYPFGM
ncbi:hypothetical protein Sa4125_18450 [Aureimonas sp. SA4125]|uniref:hypothetical protein n=1 Tax=Aureimonas sp. SA4125 TaxID=2826993 RepID=UPI001CC6FE67|nr:hypothetical protein [Aureimonas sp. SA4125]BDA84303.1 hypothetical protein Sa4125_18450 [Aureimonas sp. SA4125]